MAERIEDYGLIGDLQTAALVGRSGSIDWACFPRFDSGACFAALLGSEESGRWLIAPEDATTADRRRYRDDSLVLESEFDTPDGTVRLIDFMPPRGQDPDIVRIVEGVRGKVEMTMELVVRFDYGSIVPWVRRLDGGALLAVAGPDGLCFWTEVETRGENLTTVAEFTVAEGDRIPFILTWFPSHLDPPDAIDAEQALRDTESFWEEWAGSCAYQGEWRGAVVRSLVVLKALTYAPTGGIVAAPTTSLPEHIGGVRNWDYRFCWLRDATLTLYSLLLAGYVEEARAWRDWLLRTVAGDPADLQIMYGPAGERRLLEFELPWLPGYEGSAPVRVGNAASDQFQLDVYGEVLDALYLARRQRLEASDHAWALLRRLMYFLEFEWQARDEGIWEVRGPRRHFTHSKVMAWVAADRAVRFVEEFGREGPVDRWRRLRDEIHAEVCERGFDAELGSFVQSYGSKLLDASLLMIPLVGFLPPDDERVAGTVAAIERRLVRDGFVQRYEISDEAAEVDGLPPGEGAFLPCSFWLVDNLALLGRTDEARALFERLLAVRNDLGLLAEEYEPLEGRLVGNFPQAFSHVGLVNSAFNLERALEGPAEDRAALTAP
jgi:GH15 family glucan-1,4-alpha-glucosidase